MIGAGGALRGGGSCRTTNALDLARVGHHDHQAPTSFRDGVGRYAAEAALVLDDLARPRIPATACNGRFALHPRHRDVEIECRRPSVVPLGKGHRDTEPFAPDTRGVPGVPDAPGEIAKIASHSGSSRLAIGRSPRAWRAKRRHSFSLGTTTA